jgi:DNA-binding SARP family transcriptional activator
MLHNCWTGADRDEVVEVNGAGVVVEVNLLGPLEVTADGRPVGFARERERVLLTLLAIRTPAMVPADVLVDELWGESPPSGAHTTLRAYVSTLRRALRVHGQPQVILTGRHGYAINGDGTVVVDSVRFAALLGRARALHAAGDRAGESTVLTQALGLWRGRALEQAEGVPAMVSAARALEDDRLSALERWAECELDLGHHAELATALALDCHAHPTREDLWASWMRALYAA